MTALAVSRFVGSPLCKQLLEDFVSVKDVVNVRAVSGATFMIAEPYATALEFARTRPCTGYSSLSLSTWYDIWRQCASSVQSAGFDASTLGHAVEWVEKVERSVIDGTVDMKSDLNDDDGNSVDFVKSEVDPRSAAPIIDRVIADHIGNGTPRTAWIIALRGHYDVASPLIPDAKLSALVVLSDGRFAAVSLDCYVQIVTQVRVSSTLASLFKDGLIKWESDFGGRLCLRQDTKKHYFKAKLGGLHSALPTGSGLQKLTTFNGITYPRVLRRYSCDGVAYDHFEFLQRFGITQDENPRCVQWEEAKPCNTVGDRFIATVRNHRKKFCEYEALDTTVTGIPSQAMTPDCPLDYVDERRPFDILDELELDLPVPITASDNAVEGKSCSDILDELEFDLPVSIRASANVAENKSRCRILDELELDLPVQIKAKLL